MPGPLRHQVRVPHFSTAADDDRPMPGDAANIDLRGEIIRDVPEQGDLRYLVQPGELQVFDGISTWTPLSSAMSIIVVDTLAELQAHPAQPGAIGFVKQTGNYMGNVAATNTPNWVVLGSRSALLGIATGDGVNNTVDVDTLTPNPPIALRSSFYLFSSPTGDYTPAAGPLAGVTVHPGDTIMITPGSGRQGYSVISSGSAALTKPRALGLFGFAPHDPAVVYESGSVVVHDGQVWSALADLAAGPWDATQWERRVDLRRIVVDTFEPDNPGEGMVWIEPATGDVWVWDTFGGGQWNPMMTIPVDLLPNTATDRDVIWWDDAAQAWHARPVVELLPQGVNAGEVLFWDGTTWVARQHDLNDHYDVDTLATPPTDGQALVWSNGEQLWVPGDVAAGGLEGRVLFVGTDEFDPVFIVDSAHRWGMGSDTLPTPGLGAGDLIPIPGDAYLSTATRIVTVFDGAPPTDRAEGFIAGSRDYDLSEIPTPTATQVGHVLTAGQNGVSFWAASSGFIQGVLVDTVRQPHERAWGDLEVLPNGAGGTAGGSRRSAPWPWPQDALDPTIAIEDSRIAFLPDPGHYGPGGVAATPRDWTATDIIVSVYEAGGIGGSAIPGDLPNGAIIHIPDERDASKWVDYRVTGRRTPTAQAGWDMGNVVQYAVEKVTVGPGGHPDARYSDNPAGGGWDYQDIRYVRAPQAPPATLPPGVIYIVGADRTVAAGVAGIGGRQANVGDLVQAVDANGDGRSDSFKLIKLPTGSAGAGSGHKWVDLVADHPHEIITATEVWDDTLLPVGSTAVVRRVVPYPQPPAGKEWVDGQNTATHRDVHELAPSGTVVYRATANRVEDYLPSGWHLVAEQDGAGTVTLTPDWSNYHRYRFVADAIGGLKGLNTGGDLHLLGSQASSYGTVPQNHKLYFTGGTKRDIHPAADWAFCAFEFADGTHTTYDIRLAFSNDETLIASGVGREIAGTFALELVGAGHLRLYGMRK